MTQEERLDYLLHYLIREQKGHRTIQIPKVINDKRIMLRSLMNVREPLPISSRFLHIQDDYLQEELSLQTVTALSQLTPVQKNIYLWKGDITKLSIDAIVNAANCDLLGCFIPCHGCIDNAIHSSAGIQLRLACQHLMQQQGAPESTGTAKITEAYNLPARYVLHTVGPIVLGGLTKEHCNLLRSCYRSCLQLADQYHLRSIAFCCISTGEFHFPNEAAGRIAVDTVNDYLKSIPTELEVVFNVFQNKDLEIYQRLLAAD